MIRIYVANLAKYNAGELVGEWIDLPATDLDETLDRISGRRIETVCDSCGHGEEGESITGKCEECGSEGLTERTKEGDELAIHDYEAPFKIGEYDSIEELNELAERLEDVDEDVFEAISKATDYAPSQVIDIIDQGDYSLYYGELSDVAAQMVDEGLFGEIPKAIANYIDYEAIGRDLRHDGYTEVTLKNGTTVVVRID
jgi:antirestriction protein